MSAAQVGVVGAIDARVKAIITQVPAFGADLAPVDEDGALFATIQMIVSHDDEMEGACSELLSGIGSEVEVADNGIPIWGGEFRCVHNVTFVTRKHGVSRTIL